MFPASESQEHLESQGHLGAVRYPLPRHCHWRRRPAARRPRWQLLLLLLLLPWALLEETAARGALRQCQPRQTLHAQGMHRMHQELL